MDRIEELDEELAKRDKRIAELEKEISLAKKDEEVKKLEEIKAKDEKIKELEQHLVQVGTKKPKKAERRFSLPRITPRIRKVAACLVVFSVVVAGMFLFVNRAIADDPAIAYTDPGDGGLFADQSNGDGVNWTVNITDDVNIDHVVIQANDSGAWVAFYDSGSGLGVTYHNTSGQNGNWTGSWTTYYWKFCLKDDTGWHNTTIYSFTTQYQWGYPEMAAFDDNIVYDAGIAYKNATNDYYFWYENGAIDVKTSTTGTNWSLEPKSADIGTGAFLYNAFTYNNNPSTLYRSGNNLIRAYYDGSWNTESTGIPQKPNIGSGLAIGADAIYYDGLWNLVAGRLHQAADTGYHYLYHYTGSFPSTWSIIATLDSLTGYHKFDIKQYWFDSLAVLNGTLICTYRDVDDDLHWQTYDGVTWTDKGDIEANIGTGCSMVKDPVNQQLICIYVNGTGDLVYRTTDNLTAWSDSYTILSAGSYTIRYPHVEFIDSRLILSFSYNLRGNYNVYTISSPGYAARISGLNYTYNRIQWPDSAPDDTNVNSTVFSLKNINNRSIATIMWHFEDIGEITVAGNIKVWSNMSGTWTNSWTVDGGNTSEIDISAIKGAEWTPGELLYWKAEILDIGPVSEDLHTVDEEIYYKITFA